MTSSMSRRAMRLRSRGGVAGSDHNRGKVGGQRPDARFLLFTERNFGCARCAFVIVLGISELTEGVVPFGLEAVSDEAVVGVDSKVTTPGQLGAVAGAFDMAGTQGVSFIDACF